MGTAGQLRSVSITGHVGSEPNQELANSSDIKGAWHKHSCQLAVWNCRAEGNGPYRRKGSARCFQEGHGGALFLAALERLDQEILYLNSADYHAYAMKQIAEEKRVVEELGLKEE